MCNLGNRQMRGTALGMGILIAVVIAGLILTMAWSAGVQSQTSRNVMRSNESFYAAEAAGQLAVWRFKQDNTWRALDGAPMTGTYTVNGVAYTYSVTCKDSVQAANLWWKFDEGSGMTAADSSGAGNTGTLEGGPQWCTGRSGDALLFNGTTSYVDCGSSPTTNLVGNVSMSAWIKMNGANNDQKIGANQNGFFGGYKLCVYNQKVEFEVRDAGNGWWDNRNIGGGTLLTMGTWYHVAGVYSETDHSLTTYVDGKLDRVMTGLPPNALGATTGSFIIGREPFDPTLYFWNGIIDDVRVFNRALTPKEVEALYDTTVAISANVSGGGTQNTVGFSISVPTPPPPVPPALTTTGPVALNNATISGILQSTQDVTAATTATASTINGTIQYGGIYTPNGKITIVGGSPATKTGGIVVPAIDYAGLESQAQVIYSGTQTGKQFEYNDLYFGNKVIYVNGDVVNPTFFIGGIFPSGGTLVVNGNITFGDNQPALGLPGFPINLVATGNITTGAGFNLVGALYAGGNWNKKDAAINGPVVVHGTITDAGTTASSFTTSSFPFFDPRIVQNQPTLPMYINGFGGVTP